MPLDSSTAAAGKDRGHPRLGANLASERNPYRIQYQRLRGVTNLPGITESFTPQTWDYTLSIQEISRIEGKHPVDAFLDIALDEALETEYSHPAGANDEEALKQEIKSPYSHISLSDGGAHTRFLTLCSWPIHFLADWVRDKEIMTLEQAHYKISALPAWLADFKDRGRLRVGAWADIIIYHRAELGYLYDKPIFDTDFPGGERRLVQKPTGLRYTIVNGTVTFEGNNCTGALPGKLLRSFDMID